jgi:hypothetical protein
MPEANIDRADELMKLGRVRASSRMLHSLLARNPEDASLHGDAANILIDGERFDEARSIVAEWERRHDGSGRFDFSVEEIDSFKKAYSAALAAPSNAFERIWYRGSFIDRLRRITLRDTDIQVVIGSRAYDYRYHELRITLEKRLAPGGKWAQILRIQAPDRRISFSVGTRFSPFENYPKLLAELRRRTKIRVKVVRIRHAVPSAFLAVTALGAMLFPGFFPKPIGVHRYLFAGVIMAFVVMRDERDLS